MRVKRREVPPGPRRDPAPQRRVLKRLRKVPQRQPMLAKLLLQSRPGSPRLDPRRQRLRIDLQHQVQPAQVHRDDGAIAGPGLDTPDHAGPTSEWHDCGPRRLRPAQHDLDLGLIRREGDEVWRVRELPPESPHDISVGLPQCVGSTLVAPIGEEVPELLRHPQPWDPKLHLLQRDRRLRPTPEPKPLPDPDGSLAQLGIGGRLVLVTPPPVLEPPYQCTPFIRCAKATASVDGGLSGASSPFPFAACDSGNSLYAVLRIVSLAFGATA